MKGSFFLFFYMTGEFLAVIKAVTNDECPVRVNYSHGRQHILSAWMTAHSEGGMDTGEKSVRRRKGR